MDRRVDHQDYQRIEAAIRYLEHNPTSQPSLDDVAGHIGLSPFHFRKLFKRWAGVSPKRFLQFLTIDNAKQLLQDSASVLDTAYDVGLSGSGLLHDLFISMDTVTPGEFKQHGKELEIRYAFHDTPFGECLVAETTRGICFLGFVNHDNRDEVLEDLRARWAEASLVADSSTARSRIHQIFSQKDRSRHESVRLFLKGTNFQLKVWEALLKIPEGTIVSYGGLATALGNPQANRAVGAAVGQNPVAFLIPCHRVLRSSGDIGGYHWGTPRKKAMLAMEAARR